MKIGIASDHAGYLKKVKIIKYLSKKYEVMDYGTYNKGAYGPLQIEADHWLMWVSPVSKDKDFGEHTGKA